MWLSRRKRPAEVQRRCSKRLGPHTSSNDYSLGAARQPSVGTISNERSESLGPPIKLRGALVFRVLI